MADEKDIPPPDDINSTPVKLNFRVFGRMPSVYAQHMSIQPGQHEVVLAFFEVIAPPIVGPQEDMVKQLVEHGVVAECVARVTIANGRFPAFVGAMQQFLAGQEKDADNTGNNSED